MFDADFRWSMTEAIQLHTPELHETGISSTIVTDTVANVVRRSIVTSTMTIVSILPVARLHELNC